MLSLGRFAITSLVICWEDSLGKYLHLVEWDVTLNRTIPYHMHN